MCVIIMMRLDIIIDWREGLQGCGIERQPEVPAKVGEEEIGHRYIQEITNPLITMQRRQEHRTGVPPDSLSRCRITRTLSTIWQIMMWSATCTIRFPVICRRHIYGSGISAEALCGISGSTLCDTASCSQDAGG